MHYAGRGVEHDPDQAEHLFKLAADQGFATAKEALRRNAATRAGTTTTDTSTAALT